MTLKEFANMLDGRKYLHEITQEEEKLAKELGFVVVFGYSDDNAELRGAIDDEIGCFAGGVLEHKDLPDTIYADWCPEDMDCLWAYGTSIPHEEFCIFDDGELYCVGIVCDINKPKSTFTSGMPVWVIERDEDGNAAEFGGYVFLAKCEEVVILSSYVNDYNFEDILAYHVQCTAEDYDTHLSVFPADDCYSSKEECKAAFEAEQEE